MKYSLMQTIFNYIIENHDEFNLVNATVNEFRLYIYDGEGEYLIGGEQVYEFITDSVYLIRKGRKQ